MESKSFTGLIFLLLLLFFASQEGVDGRLCQTPSHRFKGACLNYRNCAAVCRQEGFSGGRCVGFRRRCFCTRNC